MGGKSGSDSQTAVVYFVLSEAVYIHDLTVQEVTVIFCS